MHMGLGLTYHLNKQTIYTICVNGVMMLNIDFFRIVIGLSS